MASLQDLFVSKVRAKLLQIFLSEPKEIFYVRQLVRKAGEEINAVRRELARMEQRGMVVKESRANRLYYGFKKSYLFYDELLSLAAKTSGLGGQIIKNKNKIGKIKFVMLSGRFARTKEHQPSDVDLLVVGEVVLPQLAATVRAFEVKLGRDINYTVMTRQEFEFRKKRRDPFITSILLGSRIMLIGDEEDLVSGGQQDEAKSNENRK
jgi:predicted nucleotidyltransferase